MKATHTATVKHTLWGFEQTIKIREGTKYWHQTNAWKKYRRSYSKANGQSIKPVDVRFNHGTHIILTSIKPINEKELN